MFCQSCGAELDENATVCTQCGCPVLNDKEQTKKEDHKSKNHITAGLLALFLGSFGIHKFYLRGYAQGVLFLLFCWTGFPLIVSIAEALIYFYCPQSEFEERYAY